MKSPDGKAGLKGGRAGELLMRGSKRARTE